MTHADDELSALVTSLLDELRAREVPRGHAECAHAAAVVDAGGRDHRGVTVGDGSPGTGACATRVALARARAYGAVSPRLVLCVSAGPRPVLCGLCRQTILELADSARILVAGKTGAPVEAHTLLPEAFGAEMREEAP